jgi:hypothetical protein
VDASIKEPVRIFNEVFGYHTYASCGGHDDSAKYNSYIAAGIVPKKELAALCIFLEKEGYVDYYKDDNIDFRAFLVSQNILEPDVECEDILMLCTVDEKGDVRREFILDDSGATRRTYSRPNDPTNIEFCIAYTNKMNYGDLSAYADPAVIDKSNPQMMKDQRDASWEYILNLLWRFKNQYNYQHNN